MITHNTRYWCQPNFLAVSRILAIQIFMLFVQIQLIRKCAQPAEFRKADEGIKWFKIKPKKYTILDDNIK